jgi:hypothetical protein
MTVRYLRALKHARPNAKIKIDLVEPAQGALHEAVRAISNLDANIEVRAFPSTMDAFAANPEFQTTSYDWMIASYVFYHVSPTIIPTLLDRLSPDGRLMAAMGSPRHPLREPPVLKALSKHGDSSSITSVLSSASVQARYESELETVRTEVNLNGLWDKSTGTTTDGNSFFSFIYNHDLQHFSADQRSALDHLLTNVFLKQDGKVYPEHNIFWVWRK